jgi:hypothetical protein
VTTTTGSRARLEAGVSLLAVSLVAWLAGSTVAGTTAVFGETSPGAGADRGSSAPPSAVVSADGDEGAVRIALVIGDEVATATLADSPAAREFAAALPVTIDAEDRFGQATTGRLPDELAYGGADGVVDPAAGHIYYWPPDGTIAVVTTDLGPSIPAPGLVPLGVVDAGLDALGSAGNRFDMTFQLVD